MNSHAYLRAFLAGIFVPTLVLPLLLSGFIVLRLVLRVPVPVERFIIFPMALVPSLFGLWNMLYLASRDRVHQPIGLHGAVLPLLGAPIGAVVASCLGVLKIDAHGVNYFNIFEVPYALAPVLILFAMAGYYLVWKYVVGAVNRVLGIA